MCRKKIRLYINRLSFGNTERIQTQNRYITGILFLFHIPFPEHTYAYVLGGKSMCISSETKELEGINSSVLFIIIIIIVVSI